jgi:hypothetical protein
LQHQHAIPENRFYSTGVLNRKRVLHGDTPTSPIDGDLYRSKSRDLGFHFVTHTRRRFGIED